MEKKFYTQKDIQEMTGCARSTIYNWINRDDFPKIRVGGRILVPIDRFEKWISDQLYTKRS